MAEKILSIGAGKHQLPLIEAIKAMGHQALAVDINPRVVGVNACDVYFPASINEVETVIDFARHEKITAVLTASSGAAIKTVSAVAEALDLRGPSGEAIENTSDKLILECTLSNQGILTPPFSQFEMGMEIAPQDFPILLKPVEGVGGKGIIYVGGADSLPSQPLKAAYYWEKYLAGEGISLYGLVSATGRQCILAVNKVTSGPPNFITTELLTLPLSDTYQQLFDDTVAALGINFAPFFQIDFIEHDDHLYLIDAGIELDPKVAEILSKKYNHNIYETMIKLVVG